jgi:hypothetical protein
MVTMGQERDSSQDKPRLDSHEDETLGKCNHFNLRVLNRDKAMFSGNYIK